MPLHASSRIRVSNLQLTDFLDYPKESLPTKLAQGLEAKTPYPSSWSRTPTHHSRRHGRVIRPEVAIGSGQTFDGDV